MTPRSVSLARRACAVPRATLRRRETSIRPMRGSSAMRAISRASRSSIGLVMLYRTYLGSLGDVGRPDRSERAELPVKTRRGALVAERTTRGGRDVRRGPAVLAGHAA